MPGNIISRSYNTFSGAQIKAVFAHKEIGTLQAVAYGIQREKAPIYVLGEADPLGFSRGKRGIAGSLIFVQLNDHPLFEVFNGDEGLGKFAKKKYEASPIEVDETSFGGSVDTATLTSVASGFNGRNPAELAEIKQAFYADQILPFDITIAAVNEMGQTARCNIHGVELMNEGWGMGIEDKQSDMQSTYIARAITRWRHQDSVGSLNYEGGALKLA